MKVTILSSFLLSTFCFGQTAQERPKFDIASVHASPKRTQSFFQPSAHGDRYEVKNATMFDLIRTAYSFDTDKVLGGPIWLEMDRFDILAKMPKDTAPDVQSLMLQSLLEERFHVKVHKESKQLPSYALMMGPKKPQMKESDGSGETGCKMQSGGGAPAEGGIRLMTSGPDGKAQTIVLGPGMVVTYQCRNLTMKAFAARLHDIGGPLLSVNPVLDETGLEGMWNFDMKYSLNFTGLMPGDSGEKITAIEAVEKQLGLKLEQRQVATPILLVDSAENTPTPDPPGISEAFPTPPAATEFEVASVKPVDTSGETGMPMMMRMQTLPGGRVNFENMPLQLLIARAFTGVTYDQMVGIPDWANRDRYNVIAKAPSSPGAAPLDPDALAPLMRSLLVERFGMKYHTEERAVNAYALVAAKPKLKKADPASRASCKNGDVPPGSPPATRVFICRNVTVEQFADKLQGMSRELTLPVLDLTEIQGQWDITLTYSQLAGMQMPVRPPAEGAAGTLGGIAGTAGIAAPEPNSGYTIFEALEKQLGLKLELQKRQAQVYVIDHIEQKPTEN